MGRVAQGGAVACPSLAGRAPWNDALVVDQGGRFALLSYVPCDNRFATKLRWRNEWNFKKKQK